MSITIGDAVLYLTADDKKLDQSLDSAEGKTTSWVGRVGGLLATGLTAGFVAIGAAIVGFGAAAFQAGMTMDAAFDDIRIKTGATGGDLALLEESFRTVFASVPGDAATVSSVIGELNSRLGITGPVLDDLATNLLEASRLMGGDAATNTELFTRVIGDWGIAQGDATGALDKFFVASQQSGAGMDGLMASVVQFGAPLRLMGFTLDESIGLFGQWEAQGVNAELVMGSLRIAAGKFADSGQPLRESLLATFESIKGNTDAGAALAEGMDIFGARAGPDMVAAIREGRFSIDDFTAALANSDGAIMDTAGATADFGERLDIMKNKAVLALEPLGTALMDVASAVLDSLMPAVDTILPLVSTLATELFKFFGGLSDGSDLLTAFSDLFGEALGAGLFNFITNLIGPFQALFQNLSAGMPPLNALWQLLRDTFGMETGQQIFDFITGIQGALMGFVDFIMVNLPLIQETAGVVFGSLQQVAASLAAVWSTSLQPALAALFNAIFSGGPTAQEIFTALMNGIQGGAALVSQFVSETLVPALAGFSQWIVDVAVPAITTLRAWLAENLPIAIQALATFWTTTLQPALAAVWTFITTSLIPAIVDIATWIGTNLPPLIAALATFWTTTLQPALAAVWSFIVDSLIPAIVNIATWIGTNLPPLIQTLADFWNNTLLPAITAIWSFITTYLVPLFTAVATLLVAVVGAAVEVLTGIWETRLLPIITAVHDFISTYLMPIFAAIGTFITGTLLIALADLVTKFNVLKDALEGPVGTALTWLTDHVLTPMGTTMENIKRFIIGIINKLGALTDMINSIDWGVLHPGSPTPLEIGLRGAAKAAALLVGSLGLLDRVRDRLFEKKGWEFRGAGHQPGVRRYLGLRPQDPFIGPDPSVDPFDPMPVNRIGPVGPPDILGSSQSRAGGLSTVMIHQQSIDGLATVFARVMGQAMAVVLSQLNTGGGSMSFDMVRVLTAMDSGAY